MKLKVEVLDQLHPLYSVDDVATARDLFEGGPRMREATRRHLMQNDNEPDEVYRLRCKSSHYVNYAGPAGAYFASYVASDPLRFSDATDADYWSKFSDDCDGKGTDFSTFFTEQLLEALTARKAFWLIQFPKPDGNVESLADARSMGLDHAVVRAIRTEEVVDWERDDLGRYAWIRTREQRTRRQGTGLPVISECTWTQWNADGTTRRWFHQWEGEGAVPSSSEIDEVEPPYNPLPRMPLVSIELTPALYLMGHLLSPQLESFRKRNAMSWSLYRSCFPTLVVYSTKAPKTMGVGYFLQMGKDDRVEYVAPPEASYDAIGKYNDTLVQEIHRVAQSMARGVDNNAAAIGRSGESKQADNRSTAIVVRAYADRVREAAQTTVNMIAEVAQRGEAPGLNGLIEYESLDATATIEQYLGLKTAALHSITASREAEKLVVRAFLTNIDEATGQKIDREIDAGFSEEELHGEPTADALANAVAGAMAPGVTADAALKTQTAK